MSTGNEARRYLRHHLYGVLSTISKKLAGYPFGSVVPCITDHAARPVILVSSLAEHTKNIGADPRVSLLVRDAGADPQESARLTLVGDARPVAAEHAALQARYLKYFPAAERLLALGDFSFLHVEPTMLRYVGGFGAIHWNELAVCEADIVAHMNADHGAALRDYGRHFKQRQPAMVSMIGIDCDGFDLRADGEIQRFDFTQSVSDAPTARAALKAMVAEARG